MIKSFFYFITPHSALCTSLPPSLPVVQNLQRRVAARSAHDAAAGVGGRAAHVEVSNRRAVLRPAGRGAEEEELFEREFALEDVALGETELAFEVERRQHLPVQDDVTYVRRMLGDGVNDGVAELLAPLVPVAFFQMIRRVLHEE